MGRTVGSIFSGAGGFDMGFEAAGVAVAWQIEVDRDCVSVLERHWPDVPRYGDVRGVDPSALAPVDVVVFGSPCQDLSVAGKRAGLGGERSGLFHEAARIIAGLRPKPAVCVWENVPGALSSAGGRDFGAALDALADLGALDIAWRVLDARHWGVPQRRRRVFVVADLGGERAASILFEPEGGDGHPAPGGTAGEGAAGDAEGGAGVAGVADVACFGGNNTSGPLDVATACNAHGGPHGRLDFESETFVVADTVRSHPRPGSNSVGNIVVANSVTASAGHHGHGSPRGDGSDNLIVAAPLTAGSHPNSNMPGRHREDDENIVAVAFNWQAGGGGNDTSFRGKSRQYIERAGDYAGALSTTRHDAVAKGMAVRRLTPRECEKLMGWPDDHTRYRAAGSEISDGPRYRMIGNGVVAPVAAWLAGRIAEAL